MLVLLKINPKKKQKWKIFSQHQLVFLFSSIVITSFWQMTIIVPNFCHRHVDTCRHVVVLSVWKTLSMLLPKIHWTVPLSSQLRFFHFFCCQVLYLTHQIMYTCPTFSFLFRTFGMYTFQKYASTKKRELNISLLLY